MKVRDVMTPAVVVVHSETPFSEIAHALLKNGVSGVPVLDEAGLVIGIVSEEDLIAKEAYPHRPAQRRLPWLIAMLLSGEDPWFKKAEGLIASDIMTRDVRTIGPDAGIHDAARIMIERAVKRLPVVEGKTLVGIISRHDVLRVYAQRIDEIQRNIERLLKRCAFVPPQYDVTVSVAGGEVGLDGTVVYESDVRIIEDLVTQIDGVVAVHNRLGYRDRDPKRTRLEEPVPRPF